MYIIFIFLGLTVFFKSLTVFFVQDDFYFLYLSKIHNIAGFLNYFIPQAENVWYRPLSSAVFFYLSKQLFGLNPLGYHLIVFLIHSLTIYYLFKLVKQIFKSNQIGILTAIFYGTHQLHTVSMSWLATLPFLAGPLFIILILLTYLNKKYFFALILFVLGLLISEIIILFPVVLFLFQMFIKKKMKITKIIPYIIFSLLIVVLRFFVYKTKIETDLYSINFTHATFELFRFYFFRIIGFPMLFSVLPISYKIMVSLLVIIFCSSIFLGIINLRKNFLKEKNLLFFLIFGFIGLSPFLLMPNHIAPHYLSFSYLGFSAVFAILIYKSCFYFPKKIRQLYLLVILFVYIINQLIGINLTYNTHWIFRRAEIAKSLIEQYKLLQPVGSEEYFSLGGDNAYNFFNDK